MLLLGIMITRNISVIRSRILVIIYRIVCCSSPLFADVLICQYAMADIYYNAFFLLSISKLFQDTF
jgi:hypothetical protein